jgi:hypothetical protein
MHSKDGPIPLHLNYCDNCQRAWNERSSFKNPFFVLWTYVWGDEDLAHMFGEEDKRWTAGGRIGDP